jgi:spore coat protein A, manganese oxidase
MQFTRRRFLEHMGWLTAATAAHGSHIMQAPSAAPKLLDTRSLARFVDPLPIPAVVKPAGTKPSPADATSQIPYYRIVMHEFQNKVHRDVPPTTFWGYDASCPGPTIETHSGQPIFVEWINQLPSRHLFAIDHTIHGAEADKPDVRTIVHLHGGRTGPESDGYPTDWFTTGQSATCFYPNQQDAATLFYHDHALPD